MLKKISAIAIKGFALLVVLRLRRAHMKEGSSRWAVAFILLFSSAAAYAQDACARLTAATFGVSGSKHQGENNCRGRATGATTTQGCRNVKHLDVVCTYESPIAVSHEEGARIRRPGCFGVHPLADSGPIPASGSLHNHLAYRIADRITRGRTSVRFLWLGDGMTSVRPPRIDRASREETPVRGRGREENQP